MDEEVRAVGVRVEDQRAIAVVLTGADLIGMGYEPGPQFSKILALLEDAQLEGHVHSREEAMALVSAAFPLED